MQEGFKSQFETFDITHKMKNHPTFYYFYISNITIS